MSRRLAIAVAALCVAVPSARAQTFTFTTAPEKHTWIKPRHADGFKPTKIKPAIRSVLIEIPPIGCVGGGEHTRVRRTKTAVIITLVVDVYQPADGPYGKVPPSCPLSSAHLKKVPLNGRLGHRVIKDGATTPPKKRYG